MMVLLILGSAQASLASVDKDSKPSEYTFKFRLKGELLEVHRRAATYEDAFAKAASDCASHFRKNYPSLSEDQKLDIVDVCANPRS